MVRFEKEKLVIEIQCHNSAETWMELQNGLCDIVRCVKQENIHDRTFFSVIDFIRELIPEWEDAKKMIE
jgi:hypothetical protein